MSDLKNIDKIIKDGVHKEYPIDDQLWAQASQQLDVLHPVSSKKKGWIYISLALIAAISTIYGITKFLQYKPVKTIESTTVNKHQSTPNTSNQQETTEATSSTHVKTSTIQPQDKVNEAIEAMTSTNYAASPAFSKLENVALNKSSSVSQTISQAVVDGLNTPSQPTEVENIGGTTVTRDPMVNTERRMPTVFIPILLKDKESVNFDLTEATVIKSISTPDMVNPRIPKWFVELESGVAFNTNNSTTQVVENGLESTRSYVWNYGMNAGFRLGRFTVGTGIGQATINNTYTAELAPQPRLDTISSYYALITNEYMHFEQVVSLIERRYKTQWVEDSNAVAKKFEGSSTIQYLSIPISVGYTLPLDRLELTAALSARFMIRPSFTHNAPADFEDLLAQQEQGIRPSLMMPTLDMGVGYRINSVFSVNAHARWSQSTQTLLTTDPKSLSTLGVKLGLMYRF